MGLRFRNILVAVLVIAGALHGVVRAEGSPRVMITALKLGGTVSGQPTEFIEIYNDGDAAIDVTGWAIEYAKSTAAISDCGSQSWKQLDGTSVKEVKLQSALAPQERLLIELQMNDNSAGSVRLIQEGSVVDLLGWGTEANKPACFEGEMAPVPPNAKSLKRWFSAEGFVLDTNNNAEDFTLNDNNVQDDPIEAPLADVCSNLEGIQASVPSGYELQGTGTCVQILHNDACAAIEITEIVPNPSGSDSGREFVELLNPHDSAAALDGCTLKIGSSIKQLTGLLQPGYQAYYGIVLPNAGGGTVELIGAASELAITYPADMSDDEAWANVNGVWQVTDTPTPGKANVATVVKTGSSSSEDLEPCPSGKYRNPETNRCKTIESEEGLKPCEPGQVRNAETNRCRKLDAASLTSLKSCSAGQERNPATNRCRKVAASSSSVKPCAQGQERNPETNRCRKVAGANTSNTKSGDSANSGTQPVGYFIFALVAASALSYGAYEYRQEIGNYVNGLRLKFKK